MRRNKTIEQQANYWTWQNYKTYLKFYWRTYFIWAIEYFYSTAGNVPVNAVHEYLENKRGVNNVKSV